MTRTERSRKKQKKSKKKEILSFLKDIFILFGFIFMFRTFVFDISFVSGHSMEPHLQDGSLVIIQKFDLESVDFYDIVTAEQVNLDKDSQAIKIVKRVVGLPGDRVDIIEGDLYRNGKRIDEPLLEKSLQLNQTFELGENEVFLLGDNRNNSTDSRYFGPLPIEKISGKVSSTFQVDWFLHFNEKTRKIFEYLISKE